MDLPSQNDADGPLNHILSVDMSRKSQILFIFAGRYTLSGPADVRFVPPGKKHPVQHQRCGQGAGFEPGRFYQLALMGFCSISE